MASVYVHIDLPWEPLILQHSFDIDTDIITLCVVNNNMDIICTLKAWHVVFPMLNLNGILFYKFRLILQGQKFYLISIKINVFQ